MIAVLKKPRPATVALTGAALIIVGAAVIYAMGHPLICTCGFVKLWHGTVFSSETSQHLLDWYSPSHVIHGLIFYAALWLVARRQPAGYRLLAAIFVEVSWEVFENTPLIINRYREVTISLDYYGDSVINTVADILAMVAGFILAWRLPVWVSVALVMALEAYVGFMIRDNLALNVIMLVFPMEAIRVWQSGG
ncbi:MAG: DUF2585 domain-containing protein [Alphaproteobacteria bacterium]